LPYLGFFHRLLSANEFIVLDHVRMSKRGWVHRDKIKTSNGEKWLTIPIKDISANNIIREAEIDYNSHFDKMLNHISANYVEALYYDEIFPALESIFSKKYQMLVDLNMALIDKLLEWFDIHTNITFSSSYRVTSRKSKMNVDLVTAVKGSVYLSGQGAKDYHEQEPFDQSNITVIWQEFNHPDYPQLHGRFIPFLSSIDLLFNCGVKRSRDVIRGC